MSNINYEVWLETKSFFLSNMMTKNENGSLYPKLCDIHASYENPRYGSKDHNCLGCNFADSAWLVKYFLDRVESYQSTQDIYFECLFRLYLLVERAQVIFKIIELPQKYKDERFKTFWRIKRWANFIKHPKAFMFTHEPNFCIEGGGNISECERIIDDNFVTEFYSKEDEKKNKLLLNKLSNSSKICVVFPCPRKLIEKFSKECILLESVICENAVYKDILQEFSTLEEYYENLDESTQM